MTTNTINASIRIALNEAGVVVTSSLSIAADFERAHKTVLAKIKNAGCSASFAEQNFLPSSYIDGSGRKLPCFEMTKDGFAFLVMGFTGEKAAAFKEAYIAAFNAMDAALRLQTDAALKTAQEKLKAVDEASSFMTVSQYMIHRNESWNSIMLGAMRFDAAQIAAERGTSIRKKSVRRTWGVVGQHNIYPVELLDMAYAYNEHRMR